MSSARGQVIWHLLSHDDAGWGKKKEAHRVRLSGAEAGDEGRGCYPYGNGRALFGEYPLPCGQ
jgi:hypothetical protein